MLQCERHTILVLTSRTHAGVTCPALGQLQALLCQGHSGMQERGARLNIAFEPLHNNFGVEVSGADLTKPLSDEEKMLLQASHAL